MSKIEQELEFERARFSDVAARHVGEDLTSVGYIHHITFGDLSSSKSTPLELEQRLADQTGVLNECLHRGGRIIARTSAAGVIRAGPNSEYELLLQRVTFLVGFTRPAYWLKDYLKQRETKNSD